MFLKTHGTQGQQQEQIHGGRSPFGHVHSLQPSDKAQAGQTGESEKGDTRKVVRIESEAVKQKRKAPRRRRAQ